MKEANNALNALNSNKEGKDALSTLSNSKNNFYIKNASENPIKVGANQFVDFNRNASYANALIEEKQGNPISGGSGGTIYWNPNDGALQEIGGGIEIRSTTNLGHELFHGVDANNGNLDNRESPIQLNRSEVRASYFENTQRAHLNYPLREYYNTAKYGSIRILDSNNKPINYPK
jgi:hypothetical protein